ncbi:efflux RND transporter periplasmic adaptor subunit [Ottowia sp.]|jgi:RND family efflux transporter MFP subunit|uniref:efflux RND transporter periplasmic adaptor subunit n=1 Tax=Ottowia sp. TaxID=1898956 RepID=UPI0025FEFE1E|nr:efflux RND transporter periplasmic adaptor subunit [Ottowia sp.]MBK6613598.1 efflux RND transporter periplasmic adaptor subunit [Ottowia sp.]MBK6747095.1 efflux RND transporter periplasmic adaptor subunit [Ottowia sp.]
MDPHPRGSQAPVRRFAGRAAALAALALLLAACGKPAPVEEPVRAVKLLTVGEGRLASGHEYAGEVRARVESRLGFRVAGKIVRRAVEPGQRVAAGALLAQLDARDYQLAADAGRAQVQAATTQRDLAAADLKRFEALREQGFISGAEIERRGAQLQAAQATLDQARAQLASQGNQAAYTHLVADAAGVVTGVEAEVGQVVAAGTPVVRIAQDGPRDAVFAVPEDRVAAMPIGLPMDVRRWAGGEALAGSVREVAASADPVTRTYAVKVALAGEAPPLGATVYVAPRAGGAQGVPVIKLPTSALRQEGAGSAVWVYDAASGTVRSQPVQVAMADGNDAVIAAGLAPGMQVVASGVHVLTSGQKVTIYKPKSAEAGAGITSSAINGIAIQATPALAPGAAASR